mmetsp:Transcript_45130/g.130625  ORF Transcript_45130/g.130625 Transcript_45130/m.130625 type:complete len:216 (+) Transcript_45130:356-1003(+)
MHKDTGVPVLTATSSGCLRNPCSVFGACPLGDDAQGEGFQSRAAHRLALEPAALRPDATCALVVRYGGVPTLGRGERGAGGGRGALPRGAPGLALPHAQREVHAAYAPGRARVPPLPGRGLPQRLRELRRGLLARPGRLRGRPRRPRPAAPAPALPHEPAAGPQSPAARRGRRRARLGGRRGPGRGAPGGLRGDAEHHLCVAAEPLVLWLRGLHT